MSKNGLQRRLLESHLIIAFAGILIILVLCVAAAFMGRSGVKLFESTGPIPNSSLSLINSLQASIAANHGWVYLGDRKFIEENNIAWKNVDIAFDAFSQVVAEESDVISKAELEDVTDSIDHLRQLQEGIAYVPANSEQSSGDIHASDIQPLVDQIQDLLSLVNTSKLIDQNVVLNVEKYFTETALQLELAIKSREYIDNKKYFKARDNLVLSTIPLAHRIAVDSLNDDSALVQLNNAIDRFVVNSDEASVSHQVESNNQVRQFLFEHAVPLTNKIIGVLQQVVARAQTQAELRRVAIKQVTTFSLIAAIVALAGLIVSAVVLSIKNSEKLVSRLTCLAEAVDQFSASDIYKPISVQGDDEIANLASQFNGMALAIKHKQKKLKVYQNELENRVARRTRELFGAKEFAETTLRSVGDALITVDCDLIISTFNPAAERLLTVSADRAVGQPLSSIVFLHTQGSEEFDLTGLISQSMESRQLISPEETLQVGVDKGAAVPIKMSLAPIADMKANNGGTILILRNVEREIALQSELSYQANHDPLTGLRNRASFNAEVESVLNDKSSEPRSHVIAFLDLDKFKLVNDSCGHAAGDELLKQISRLLSLKLRTGDLLARLGGDEFAILLRDCDIDAGKKVAMNLRDSVASHRFSWGDRVFSVGVSIGITQCFADSTALKDILTDADLACYAAKAAGRNKVRVSQFTHADVKESEHKKLTFEALDHDLREQAPELQWRNLNTSMLPNIEALYEPSLEFTEDDGTVIADHLVWSAVERFGLCAAYERCLLAKALSVVRGCQQKPESHSFGLLVRLSEALLVDDAHFEQLSRDLEQASLNRDTLIFCFSEHNIFKNLESARARLDVLNSFGVRTVMEDFSGSFSSIANIRGLSIDYLQIDPAIANDILLNPVHHIVVRTICELAHVSGKQTIAKGDFDKPLSKELLKLGVNVILPDSKAIQTQPLDALMAAHVARFHNAS